MTSSTTRRLTPTALLATTLLGAALLAPPAHAASDWLDYGPPDPAGIACQDFPVQIQTRGALLDFRELPGKDGSIRFQAAGKDADYRFINADDPSKTYTTKAAYRMAVTGMPGSQVLTINGRGWVILFPEDKPAGPSTTAFSGTMVLAEGAEGWEVTKWTGKKVDVCAAIS